MEPRHNPSPGAAERPPALGPSRPAAPPAQAARRQRSTGIGKRSARAPSRSEADAGTAASHYRAIVEMAPDAIVVVDHSGHITTINRQTEALFGYAREELIGRPIEVLVPARFRAAHRRHRARFAAVPAVRPMGTQLQLFGRRRDGTEFPVEVSLSPFEDAGEFLVISTIRDMSERRRTEAARANAERASEELRRLQSISYAALAHADLDTLLPALLDRIRAVLAVDNVAILLASTDGRTLTLYAARGTEEAVMEQVRVRVGRGVAGRIAATRRPLIVDDLNAIEIITPLLRERLRSLVGVPLLVGDRLVGVVQAASASPRRFSEDDIRLLQLVGERIAYALDRTQLHSAERAAHREAEAVNEELRRLQAITDTALSHLSLDDLLRELSDRIGTIMDVHDVGILLLDPESQMLTLRAARGLEDAVAASAAIPVGRGFSGRVAATRAPLIVDDLASFDVVYPQLRETERSAVGVPLLVDERLLGVVHVASAVARRFTDQDVQLLQRAADRIAVAIDRARLFEEEQAARREAEAARAEVQRQANQLDRIFEGISDGLLVYDAAGLTTHANAAARRLLGLDAGPPDYSELPSPARMALYEMRDGHGRRLAPEEAPSERALRGETLTGSDAVDLRVRTLDGRELEISAGAAPLRDRAGRIVGAVDILRDQTERRQLERANAEQAEQIERIFEGMADGLIVYDAEGRVLRTNAAARHLLGLDAIPPEGPAPPVHEWSSQFVVQDEQGLPLAPADWPVTRILRGEVLAGPRSESIRVSTPDGREMDFIASGGPLHDREGALVGAVVFLHDQGERNRLAREREAARASELALREVNQRLDTFFSMAAHDLRSPVAVTMMRVQLAQQQVLKAAESAPSTGKQILPFVQVAKALSTAEQDLGRLLRLVKQLLDVSRARAGTLALQRAPCELDALVRAAVEDQRLLSPGRVLTLDLPDALPVTAHADADRLGQVIANYLSNADRYSPADRPIEVALCVVGDAARVDVRDHGRGIPFEEQEGIWGRFQRAQSLQEAKGLGLGLYIARMIVTLHGGDVGVESAPGEGATFWFTVPLLPGRSADNAAAATA